ncbi:MAG: nitrilase-related carbon-nitrogen hydrolase, partial [Candidatus Thiodiazotropha endolucinida]
MKLKIVLAQLNFLVGDIEGNAQRIIDEAMAHVGKADAIVFPELAITGYPPEDLLLRDHFIQRVELTVAHIVSRVRGIHLVVGYPRRRDGELYNVAG